MKPVIFLLLLLIGLGASSPRRQSQEEEYALKAAFIYNFTKFIEWPPGHLENGFRIGVVGSSPIIEPLDEITRTKTAKDKKITLWKYNYPEDIRRCNILFIPNGCPFSLDEILQKVPGKGTLIITEKTDYAKRGAAINFVIVGDKVRFEANIHALDAAGLTASSQLLKLAILIGQN